MKTIIPAVNNAWMQLCKLVIFSIFIFGISEVSQVQAQQQPASSTNSASGTVVYHQEVNTQYLSIQSDTLHFNRTKSIFHWNLNGIAPSPLPRELEDVPVGGTIKMQAEIYHGSRVNLYDSEKDSLFSLMGLPNINKLLYLKERAPRINWSIKDSTKSVGNYTVQKATAHFRGRDYTAWFSPEIPVPFGPWKLHGLPGLILQAYDQTGNIYFSATDITLKEVGSIGPVTLTGNEELITLAEYKEITKNFEKHQRQSVLKSVRPYIKDVKEVPTITFKTKPVKHMEIFENDNTNNQ